VVAQLLELRAAKYAQRDGQTAEDEYFFAEQNARLAQNAEQYYRSMFRGRVSSWNLRDQHMVETLDALAAHLERRRAGAKIVVWAHNSHLGDARATEMGERGEWNVGQLVRERYGPAAILVGFTTHDGTVTAATDWDEPAQRKRVQPSLPSSIERICHETGIPWFTLDLRGSGDAQRALSSRRLERAIGVIYRPETERASHYFNVHVPRQFDILIHIDHTRALEPLEREAPWTDPEPSETYPTGL
jgi:erythromycin esterase-like protein